MTKGNGMGKFTPGPREADTEAGPSWANVRMGKDLVQVHAGAGDHYKANARLIAAAPDLLEACKALLECESLAMEYSGSPEEVSQRRLEIKKHARAAIAKAEGRQC